MHAPDGQESRPQLGMAPTNSAPDESLGSTAMNQWRFKLLYDGECPLCRREARFLQARNRHGRLAFEDITAPGFDPALYHTTRENLMGVIHGVFPDGRMVQRVEVFREAYLAVGLGWVLAPTAWPGLRWLADRGYLWFARHRLAIGKFFGRRCESGACAMPDRTGSESAKRNMPPVSRK